MGQGNKLSEVLLHIHGEDLVRKQIPYILTLTLGHSVILQTITEHLLWAPQR